MPAFEPFRAVRYAATHDLARVTAPPYDVLSDTDVDELAALDPHNVVRVDVPRGGDERYSEAAVTLNDWLATGDLVTDDDPTFTIYRRRFTDATGQRRELSGVLGALEVVDEGSGEVLAHGVMGGLASLGVQVPRDVSVIGCDDVLATTTHPPLSTIAVDLRAVAEASMAMLLEGPGAQPSGRTLLLARLVLRGTVGPAPRVRPGSG